MKKKSTDELTTMDIPEDALKTITVEDLYEDDKYDFSKMEEKDVFKLLEYVIRVFLYSNYVKR